MYKVEVTIAVCGNSGQQKRLIYPGMKCYAKVMEFRGIINLGSLTSLQFSQYLVEKESELSLKIINSIQIFLETSFKPSIPEPKKVPIKLGDAISIFGKKVRAVSITKESKMTKEHFSKITSDFNQWFWNYLEILENSITELILQIKLSGLRRFNYETSEVIHAIKMTLMHHLEDLEWGLKRLEKQLEKLRLKEKQTTFSERLMAFFPFFHSNLDPSLLSNVQKSKRFLSFNYQKFHQDLESYHVLIQNVKKNSVKFSEFFILDRLDNDSKRLFIEVYDLLKMLEVNQQIKMIPENDIQTLLSNLDNSKRISHIFEEYQTALQREVFERSRIIKSFAENLLNKEKAKSQFIDRLFQNRKEAHLLAATAAKYREFLLNSDPNPYIRSRLGYGEWIAGQEPTLTKNLKSLIYDTEETNRSIEKLIYAVQTTKSQFVDLSGIRERCDLYLHEMSQPLISQSSTKHYAEKILNEISNLGELETFDFHVVDFVGEILARSLKHDWKYHMLFDIPDFEKIYAIHIGILEKEHENRIHLNRMNEFMKLGKEIKDLLKLKTANQNSEEMVFHLNDIKSCLQDFLGYVQHLVREKEQFRENLREISFQLLEYRYFFGKYFYELERMEQDTQSIRNQLLFVNQYLDVVDGILGDFVA